MFYRLADSKFQTIAFTKDLSDIPSMASYRSTYLYNQDAVDQWKSTGSVAGITDVVTDQLWWDIDSKDLNSAKRSLTKLIKKLLVEGYPVDNMDVRFSGSKGFHLLLTTDKTFTAKQVQTYCSGVSEGIEGIDSTLYDSSQLIRLVNTINNKSNLFCVQLNPKTVDIIGINDIKKLAESPQENIDRGIVMFNKNVLPVEEKKERKSFNLDDLDYQKKPEFLDNAKWALQNGFFYGSASKNTGDRTQAFLCLAATYKNIGFAKEHTYRLLKGVAEIQSERTGEERFSDVELWNSTIKSVYGPAWKGGQFSVYDKTGWLYKYAKEYNIDIDDDELEPITKFGDVGVEFSEFIENIEANTIKTGLKRIDEMMPLTIGMNLGILGSPGSGKCYGPNTEILMYDCSIKLAKDIKTGDLLMGDDSTPRTVLGTTSGREKMYRVHTDNGHYDVNASHILSLKCSYSKSSKYKKNNIYNINVEDYLKKSFTERKYLKGYRVPLNFESQDIEIDPYLFGSWLGDGTRVKPEITNADKELEIEYQKIADNVGLNYKTRINPNGRCNTHCFTAKKGDVNYFRNYILSTFGEGKFIPKNYLINSVEVRREVLAGLLDTDGHYESDKVSYDYITKDLQLAKDIQFLCRSLGIKCTMNEAQKGIKSIGFMGTYYRLYIVGAELANINCRVERKQYKHVKKQRDELTYPLNEKIEDIGEGEYYGFELDGNHLHCLADLTVTHNTSLALDILENTSKAGVCGVFASLDMYRTRIFEKLIYRLTGLSRDEVYRIFQEGSEEKASLMKLVESKYENVYFFDKPGATPEDISKYVVDIEKQTGKKMKYVLIDYFERLGTSIADTNASAIHVFNGIQNLIVKHKLAAITLVQPNKSAYSGGPDTPLLNYNGIKGSAIIAQGCRGILSVWRPFYNPEWKDYDNYMQIGVLKNDLGELGVLNYGWEGKRGLITELTPEKRSRMLQLIEQKKEAEEEKKSERKASW